MHISSTLLHIVNLCGYTATDYFFSQNIQWKLTLFTCNIYASIQLYSQGCFVPSIFTLKLSIPIRVIVRSLDVHYKRYAKYELWHLSTNRIARCNQSSLIKRKKKKKSFYSPLIAIFIEQLHKFRLIWPVLTLRSLLVILWLNRTWNE
jgi:hypothetical protein